MRLNFGAGTHDLKAIYIHHFNSGTWLNKGEWGCRGKGYVARNWPPPRGFFRGVHFPPTSGWGLRSTYSVFFAQKLVIFIFHPARFWQGKIKTQLGMHGERKGASDYPAPVARACVRWPMWIVGDSGEGFSF